MTLNKKKLDTQKLTDCLRSNSDKQNSENKQKFAILLVSANKGSLCSGIQTYFFETTITVI